MCKLYYEVSSCPCCVVCMLFLCFVYVRFLLMQTHRGLRKTALRSCLTGAMVLRSWSWVRSVVVRRLRSSTGPMGILPRSFLQLLGRGIERPEWLGWYSRERFQRRAATAVVDRIAVAELRIASWAGRRRHHRFVRLRFGSLLSTRSDESAPTIVGRPASLLVCFVRPPLVGSCLHLRCRLLVLQPTLRRRTTVCCNCNRPGLLRLQQRLMRRPQTSFRMKGKKDLACKPSD